MKVLLSLTFILFSFFSAEAYAISGVEITYKCIDTLKFQVYVKTYRNCLGTPAPSTQQISVRCGSSILTQTLSISSIKDITPLCHTESSRCNPSNTYKTGDGLEEHLYSGIVDFNTSPMDSIANCGGRIHISVSINSRNGNITTGPSGNLYSFAEIDLNNAPCNSSPDFTSETISVLCCNQPVYFNIGARDTANRDSLSYSLASPQSGYGSPVSYTSPFSNTLPLSVYNPLPNGLPPIPSANPPIGLYLNPTTGDIIFTPTDCGQVTVAVIEVTEWQKNDTGVAEVIGITRRDLMYIIKSCPNNNPPIINGPYSYSVCEENQLCFNVTTSDAVFVPSPPASTPAPDTVTTSWNSGIPGATFTILDTSALLQTGRFCWTPPKGSGSSLPYTFTVTARDNACPLNAVSTRGFRILVKPKVEATRSITKINDTTYTVTVSIDTNTFEGTPSYQNTLLDFTNFTTFESRIAHFKSTNSSYSAAQIDTIHIKRNVPFVLSTMVNNSPYNCPISFTDTIYVDSIFTALIQNPDDTLVCAGTDQTLVTTTEYPRGTVHYQWFKNNTVLTNDTLSSLQVFHIAPLVSDTFKLKVIDTTGNTNEDYIIIRSRESFNNGYLPSYGTCLGDSIILTVDSMFSDMQWNSIPYSTYSRTFYTTENVTISFTDTAGCSNSESTELTFYDLPTPNLGADTAACEGYFITLNAGNYTSYTWNDNSTSSTLIVNTSGIYSVTVMDSNSCTNSDSIQVTMHTNPDLFLGNDTAFCGDSLLLVLAPSNSYSWSTGDTLNFISIKSTGDYWVTLKDSNGCSASDTVNITLLSNTNVPVLTRTGNLIFSNLGGIHQWFNNAIPINGLSDSFITISDTGKYNAVSIDSNGCISDTSNTIIKTLGIDKLSNSSLKVYPNPTSGKITVETAGLGRVNSVRLYDNLGKQIENTQTIHGTQVQIEWVATNQVLWIVVETDKGTFRSEVISVKE